MNRWSSLVVGFAALNMIAITLTVTTSVSWQDLIILVVLEGAVLAIVFLMPDKVIK